MARQEDGNDLHPKAVERRVQAYQRLAGSSVLGLVGCALMVKGDNPWLGLAAACLGFGLATFADIKSLKQ